MSTLEPFENLIPIIFENESEEPSTRDQNAEMSELKSIEYAEEYAYEGSNVETLQETDFSAHQYDTKAGSHANYTPRKRKVGLWDCLLDDELAACLNDTVENPPPRTIYQPFLVPLPFPLLSVGVRLPKKCRKILPVPSAIISKDTKEK